MRINQYAFCLVQLFFLAFTAFPVRASPSPYNMVKMTITRTVDTGKIITKTTIDTEDIIAVFAGTVSLIFAIGMYKKRIPINKLTIGVLGSSGVGIVIEALRRIK